MCKVLIVDDEEIIRKNNRDLLEARGFEAFEAQDGHEASVILVGGEKMGLVVLDIRMPVVDGPSVVDVIRVYSPETKIVVSSVYPLDDQKRLINNADAYHEKSEGPEMLMSRIESVLPQGDLYDRAYAR
jgi:CheY-like chemotaxis protein